MASQTTSHLLIVQDRQAGAELDEEKITSKQVNTTIDSTAEIIVKCRPTMLDKFSETGWRWLFYFSAHVTSVLVLYDKPWVWNTFYCWYGYPFHSVGK